MRQFYVDNEQVIKTCIDKTIDDLIERAQDVNANQNIDYMKLIRFYEDLRRKLWRKTELTPYEDNAIWVILSQRYSVIKNQSDMLLKAQEELKQLVDEFKSQIIDKTQEV